MQGSDAEILKTKLRAAERSFRENHYDECRKILGEIDELDYPLEPKELLQKAEALHKKIDRVKGLRISRRILTATVLSVGITLAGLTLFKTRSTLVEIEVHCKRVAFVSGAPVKIGLSGLERIDLFGIQNLDLPYTTGSTAYEFTGKGDASPRWKSLSNQGAIGIHGTDPYWSINISGDYVRLSDLDIPKGCQVVFESREISAHTLSLNVRSPYVRGTLDVGPEFLLSCNACELTGGHLNRSGDGMLLRLKLPTEQIDFSSSGPDLGIGLTLSEKALSSKGVSLASDIPVSALDFTELIGDRVQSSILDTSEVSLVELGGKQIKVRPGEKLNIGRLRDFRLKRLYFDKHIVLIALGEVGTLKTGSGRSLRDRLPSYIEWLRENQTVQLFVGILISVISAILAILYRLKILDER